MRLIHIITSLEIGGAQAILYDLIAQFKKKGYDQTLIYFHDGPYYQRFVTLKIPIIHLRGILSPFDPVGWYRLVCVVRQFKPDCMHTVLWGANLMGRFVARLLGIPCMASLHNNYDQNGIIRNIIDRLISYQHIQVIAVSEEVKKSFQRYYPIITPKIILNGVNVEALQQKAMQEEVERAELDLLPEHFVIGSVGRFHSVKRYPLLLHAFAKFHEWVPCARLLLIGAGKEETRLRALAEQLNIAREVRWVVGKPAYRYYQLFDLFVLTSEKEGISVALLEAMALGRCCAVTYHVADHPVLKNNCSGFVAQAKNATELGVFFYKHYTSKKCRKKVAETAQQVVAERFSTNSMIASYEAILNSHTHTICTDRG